MLVYSEISLMQFETWSGATETKKIIIENDKVEEFEDLIEGSFPDGLSATRLNDILWFDREQIFEYLGIENEE